MVVGLDPSRTTILQKAQLLRPTYRSYVLSLHLARRFYIMKASSTSSQKIDPRHCTPGGHLICDVAPLPPIGCWPEPGSHRHVDQPHHVSTTAGLKHADFGDSGPSEVASGCLQEFTPPHS
jgi:hypothetical protein